MAYAPISASSASPPQPTMETRRIFPSPPASPPSSLSAPCLTAAAYPAKRGFASRPTLYRAIKDGRLTAHQDGDKKTLDLADLVKVFGEPGSKPAPAAKLDEALDRGRLEADRDRLAEEVDRLRRAIAQSIEQLESIRNRFVGDGMDHRCVGLPLAQQNST